MAIGANYGLCYFHLGHRPWLVSNSHLWVFKKDIFFLLFRDFFFNHSYSNFYNAHRICLWQCPLKLVAFALQDARCVEESGGRAMKVGLGRVKMARLLFGVKAVLLFSLLWWNTNKQQLEGRVHVDSEFEGAGHHDEEVRKTVSGHVTVRPEMMGSHGQLAFLLYAISDLRPERCHYF